MAVSELIAPAGSFDKWPVDMNAELDCHTHGRARRSYEDGSITETAHFPGDTKHMTYAKGEHLVHPAATVSATGLLFTTVEFTNSANAPLPVPDAVRLKVAA